jgi:hypothetical protein
MSAIFDGIINDGVFANIGTAFGVKSAAGNSITVGIGRAWFNSTWLLNDAILPMTAEASEVLLDRYDAVVIEIDHSDSVREGSIKIISGTPSSSPQRPAMTNTMDVHQYPLAYIYRKAGSSEITQSNITNMVGTSSCPYITGILQVLNIDNIVAQWQDQWNQWFAKETEEGNNEIAKWMSNTQLDFNTWFGNLKVILDGDVATKLSEQILELQNRFGTLAKEYCVYQDIDDSDDNGIEDSYGTTMEGKIVYKIV